MKKQYCYIAFHRGVPFSLHYTWADWNSVIRGFSHCSSKKFNSLLEAEEVLAGVGPSVGGEVNSERGVEEAPGWNVKIAETLRIEETPIANSRIENSEVS